jgi:hypothetical protein
MLRESPPISFRLRNGATRLGRLKDWVNVKNLKHPDYRRVQDEF